MTLVEFSVPQRTKFVPYFIGKTILLIEKLVEQEVLKALIPYEENSNKD